MGKNVADSSVPQITEKRSPQIFRLQSKRHRLLVQVDFTPVKAISQLKGKKMLTQFSIIPTFNIDKKFYSQAFFNPYQGLQIDKNLIVKHQQRVKQISTQIPQNSILMPKPRRKDHCWVCHCQFEDYLQHIKSQAHSLCIKASQFNADINALVEKYERTTSKQKIISIINKKINKNKIFERKGKI